MAVGLVGRKCGMTRVYTPEGNAIPVTVIEVEANQIVQLKTEENDCYSAVQIKAGNKKANKVPKALKGHYAKASVEPGRLLHEFRLSDSEVSSYNLGDTLSVDLFKEGQKVNVTATSKGKGFAGAIKRHNFSAQDNTHGNSLSHRAPGSIGQNQSPGKVFKGKKMCGHMGNVRTTTRNLEVIRVNAEKNIILLKGAVPGHAGSDVVITGAK